MSGFGALSTMRWSGRNNGYGLGTLRSRYAYVGVQVSLLLNKMNPDEEGIHRLLNCLRKKQKIIFNLPCWRGFSGATLQSGPLPSSAKIQIRPCSNRQRVSEGEGDRARSPLPSPLVLFLLHFFRLSRSFADLDSEAAAMSEKETLAASHTDWRCTWA